MLFAPPGRFRLMDFFFLGDPSLVGFIIGIGSGSVLYNVKYYVMFYLLQDAYPSIFQ